MSDVGRISAAQLQEWRIELRRWSNTDVFTVRIEEILQRPEMGPIFFKQAGLDFLRDAWIASQVAKLLSANQVRLCSMERPDFELQTNSVISMFEATEADMDGRRRGDEDWTPGRIEYDPIEDWREQFEAMPAALTRVVAKKLKKPHYEADVNLVIYVNLGCYGIYMKEGIPIMREITRMAKDRFRAVFTLWEGVLFRFWNDGRADHQRWHAKDLESF